MFNLITTSLWSVPGRFYGDGGIADLEILNIWLSGLLLLRYGLQHVMQAFWCSLLSDIWNRAKTNWPVCLIRGRVRWPHVKSHWLKRNLRGICKHGKGSTSHEGLLLLLLLLFTDTSNSLLSSQTFPANFNLSSQPPRMCILTLRPCHPSKPNFILVGFSKAGFAQVVCFLKYLFCRPFTQHRYFYSEQGARLKIT